MGGDVGLVVLLVAVVYPPSIVLLPMPSMVDNLRRSGSNDAHKQMHSPYLTQHLSVNSDDMRRIAPVPQVRAIHHYSFMYCAAIDQGTTR